ncbi:MAG: UDP-N-acetylmuramoyl-tripeptide--D-alanyl-D-alanine ligase [Leadbetterella sp.]
MEISALYDIYKLHPSVNTDTRSIEEGQLFFALKGDKFDANTFAEKALEAGAAYVVIDNPVYKVSEKCIVVQDVLTTLQNLARYHRLQSKAKVIGLTGSNGKTTNKELLMRVLAQKYQVHATKGNLNNHIGVPLTLLSMPSSTEIAIIEMGANHQKEIAMLSAICEPDFGFITNIGKAHLEGFGGPEGVRKGKGELYDFLKSSLGTIFTSTRDSILMDMIKEKEILNVVYYGEDKNALTLQEASPFIKFTIPNGTQYTCHISGEYNFENMQTAYAIGQYFGISPESAAEAIAGYNPDNNRSQSIEIESNSFLMDAYNANPSSMHASVGNFGNLATTKKKVVILGDMFELGEYAQSEHENLGKWVAEQNFDKVVLYGENMKHALMHNPNAYYFTDKFSLHNWLMDSKFSNTYFLVKGSRSVQLESVLGIFKL